MYSSKSIKAHFCLGVNMKPKETTVVNSEFLAIYKNRYNKYEYIGKYSRVNKYSRPMDLAAKSPIRPHRPRENAAVPRHFEISN